MHFRFMLTVTAWGMNMFVFTAIFSLSQFSDFLFVL